jgi:hypothetical protein
MIRIKMILMIKICLVFIFCKPEVELEYIWKNFSTEVTSPSVRSGHSLSYIGNGRVILFGGYDGTNYLQDTWIYNTVSHEWLLVDTLEIFPSVRSGHSLSYIGNGRVILFGGYDGTNYLQDTWEYNISENKWTEYNKEGFLPSARIEHTMTFCGDGKLVLFGGESYSGIAGIAYYQDTWLYEISGHEWSKLEIGGTNPPSRSKHTMSFCGDGKLVLFGGYIYKIGLGYDTWKLDIKTLKWTKIENKITPSKRVNHSMSYIGNNISILFGGYGSYSGNNYLSDTWFFDSSSDKWIQGKNQKTIPPIRKSHSQSYVGDGKVLLFGGETNDNKLLSDTWECFVDNLEDFMTYNNDVPIMSVNKTSIDFGSVVIGNNSQCSFEIMNIGTGEYNWSIFNNFIWLNIDLMEVKVEGTPKTINLSINSSELNLGKYEGSFIVSSDTENVQGSPKVINFSVYVGGLWKQHNPVSIVPSSRFSHDTAVLNNNNIVLFGGYGLNDYSISVLSDTWEYDSSTRNWTKINITGSIPNARQDHTLTYIDNNQALLFGGYDGNNPLQDTWVYESTSNTWTEPNISGDIPTARYSHSTAYAGNNKLVMFGGYDGISPLQDTWIYESTSNTWTEPNISGDIPTGRISQSMCFIDNDKVVMFGGSYFDDGWNNLNDLWIYDLSSNQWGQVVSDNNNNIDSSYSHQLSYIGDNKVVIFGGDVDNIWMFDLESNDLKEFDIYSTYPSMRRYSSMSYIGNGGVLLFGGWSSSVGRLNDIWEYDGGDLPNNMF